jgi:hypothetical protein
MKTKVILILLMNLLAVQSWSQNKYFTKTGSISFYSHTPMEDIRAENHQVTSIIDFGDGGIVFAVLIKSFEFKKSLMQEHFNENYMESTQYPKATFEGKILNIKEVDPSKPGMYPVKVSGNLTIKDKSNPVETEGTLTVSDDGKIAGNSVFSIKVEDYNIEIPNIVREKIAESVEITCEMVYEPYNR